MGPIKDLRDFIPYYGMFHLARDQERIERLCEQMDPTDPFSGSPPEAIGYIAGFIALHSIYGLSTMLLINDITNLL